MRLFTDDYKRYTIKGHPGVHVFMEMGDGSGPLTTKEDYEAFKPGYAHVFSDGTIRRYGEMIGTKDDLVEVVDAEAKPCEAITKEARI